MFYAHVEWHLPPKFHWNFLVPTLTFILRERGNGESRCAGQHGWTKFSGLCHGDTTLLGLVAEFFLRIFGFFWDGEISIGGWMMVCNDSCFIWFLYVIECNHFEEGYFTGSVEVPGILPWGLFANLQFLRTAFQFHVVWRSIANDGLSLVLV